MPSSWCHRVVKYNYCLGLNCPFSLSLSYRESRVWCLEPRGEYSESATDGVQTSMSSFEDEPTGSVSHKKNKKRFQSQSKHWQKGSIHGEIIIITIVSFLGNYVAPNRMNYWTRMTGIKSETNWHFNHTKPTCFKCHWFWFLTFFVSLTDCCKQFHYYIVELKAILHCIFNETFKLMFSFLFIYNIWIVLHLIP